MPNIKFEIDKARGDSFYRYKKIVDGKVVTYKNGSSVKWGLYSTLQDDDERHAWLAAVEKFNKDNNIETTCDKIKNELRKFKDSISIDDKQFPERQSYLMPALQAAVDAVGGIAGICSDDYINTLMKACGGALPTKENMLKYATEAFENNLTLDIQILLSSLSKLGVTAFVEPLINAVEEIIDTYFGTIDLIYNEIERKYANVLHLYRKWSSDIFEENKNLVKEKFIAELKKLSQPVREWISYILTIDVLKALVEVLKSIKTIGQNIANEVFTKFNNLKDVLNEISFPNKNRLIALLNTLLFALGGFVGAIFAARCAKEQEIDATINSMIAVEGVDNEDELYDKVVNKNPQAVRNKISPYTTIYTYAVENKENYSLYKIYPDYASNNYENNVPNISDNINCLCKVSMCETIDDTDTTDWTAWLDKPADIIIEFDMRLNYSIIISVGQSVLLNDIIGYINNIPIKARDEFIVTEIGKNFIIGKYQSSEYDSLLTQNTTNINEVSLKTQKLLQKKIDEFSDNQFDKIINDYKKIAQVKNFIRDYISYFRFPDLAIYTKEYTSDNVTAISTDKFIELYEKSADKILEDHQKDIKKSCKKSNLKKYTDSFRMTELKEMLDTKNDNCLRNILTLYNENPGNMKYCSQGRICDFMLYSHYVEYLYSDKFVYDEDNPFIVKLSNKLNYFIGRRTRLELNKDNLDSLIESFNDACDSLLKIYWKYDVDYYTKLSELFKYDTYTNTELISEGTPDNSISLYKRLENYLKSLTKFEKRDEYADVDVNNCADYNKLLEEQSKEENRKINKTQEEFEKQLRKITYRFVSLRRIELSLNDADLTTYIDKDALSRFENVKKAKGDIVYNYESGKVYLQTDPLYNTKSSLDPYLQALKKLTDEESKELKELVDDAKNYYIENNDRINSCEDLFLLAEYSWPVKSLIYKNNEPKDYYLFSKEFTNNSPVPKNFNDLKKLESTAPLYDDPDDEILNLGCSPKTNIGIDNILYWLKYCALGTLVNCMLPMYWGTGLVVPSKIPLPIIYIPIVVIKVSSMIIVIGIGLCGMFPWPMIIFVNPGATKSSIIIPITLAIDYVTKLVQQIPSLQKPAIEGVLNPLIKSLDTEINTCINEEETIKYQQEQIKSVVTNYELDKKIDTIIGLDTTTKATEISNTDVKENLLENSNILDINSSLATYEYENIDDLNSIQDKLISELETNHFSYDTSPESSYDDMISNGEIITDYMSTDVTNRLIGVRRTTIEYIVVHYTAGTSSKKGQGKRVCDYWNDYNKVDASTGKYIVNGCGDFVVDDEGIYQYNHDPLKYYCAAVGDSPVDQYSNGGASMKRLISNYNSISVEICSNLKDGYVYKNTEANSDGWYFTNDSLTNAITLIRSLLDKYNIPKENIYRHFDVSGKSCPGVVGWNPRTKNEDDWIKFKNSI